MKDQYVYELASAAMRKYCIEQGMDFNAIINDTGKLIGYSNIGDNIPSPLKELSILILKSKEEIIKKSTGNHRISALKRIYNNKHAIEHNRQSFVRDGKQYILDGYRAICLDAPIDLFPEAEKPLDSIIKLMDRPAGYNIQLSLPSVQELKLIVTDMKTQGLIDRDKMVKPYYIESVNTYVHTEYLIDMFEIFPEAKIYSSGNNLAPLYFEAEDGKGILCPVHPAMA